LGDSYDSTPGLLALFLQEKLVPKDCFHGTTGRLRFMLEFENKKYVDVVNFHLEVYIMFVPQSPQRT
jgi:hypothetical protein